MRGSRFTFSHSAQRSRLVTCVCSLSLLFALGACSSETSEPNAPVAEKAAAPEQRTSAEEAAASNDAGTQAAPTDALTLAGLGDLRIGEAIPEGSQWAERGAQASDECRTVTSPEYPGAYAIVIDDTVQRITLGQRSDLTLDGLGIGAAEEAVRERFPALTEDLHKYESPPAKYLTSPDASEGRSAMRFEIGSEGVVKLIHVGRMPVLAYVEGCS